MNFRSTIFCLAAFLVVSTYQQLLAQDTAAGDAVRQVLRDQQRAWNEGRIDGFMKHYWNSEELLFCSEGKRKKGWQTVYDGYKKNYSTAEKMGKLEFANLEVRTLGETAAMVIGDWELTRQSDTPRGNFSLVFRRIDGAWLIVHDHTSSLDE